LAFVLIVVLAVRGLAHAAPDTELRRFRLAYTPEAGCPDRAAFLQAITSRSARARLVAEDVGAVGDEKKTITIDARVDDHAGHFSFKEPDGAIEEKDVTGTSCSEIAHALALSLALLLDPESSSKSTGSSGSSGSSSVASSATLPSPKPTENPPIVHRPLQPTGRTWHPSGGAELGAISGTGPAISPLVALFFELDHASFFGRSFTSSLRLGFQAGETSSNLRAGSHTYELFVGNLRACPLLTPLSREIRIGPCAAFQIGGHRGTTRNVQNPESSTELWLAPLVLGSLEWTADRRTTLELSGGIVFPLRRSRFFLAPDTTIYEVPRIGASATISARFHFL
jgi:hypothetical protein